MDKYLIKSIEEITKNTNLTYNEKRYLYTLALAIFETDPNILKNISFNGYAECCLCFIKENDNWKLSHAERGNWHYTKEHDTINSLCDDLINRLFNLEDKEKVINSFNKLLKKEQSKIKKL